jgi:hypothetical protein
LITQKMKQGENEIIIESAESLEDAKKNNFREGEYARYKVNGKPVDNYMSLIKFMVTETHKNGSKFIPNDREVIEMRNAMLRKQGEDMKNSVLEIKKLYGGNVPEEALKILDEMVDKIDQYGMRVVK